VNTGRVSPGGGVGTEKSFSLIQYSAQRASMAPGSYALGRSWGMAMGLTNQHLALSLVADKKLLENISKIPLRELMEHLHIPIQTSALFGSIPLLAPLATDAKPSIPQPPDDAAMLIAKCGEPDADKSGELPSRRTQTVTRSLLYRKGGWPTYFPLGVYPSRWRGCPIDFALFAKWVGRWHPSHRALTTTSSCFRS